MSNIPFDTQDEYYSNEDLHGIYQYVTLSDVVNNFILNYTGDDKLINNVKRNLILFHAKRGLQEINYDALKEVKAVELDLSESLTLILPDDYVNFVRVSWIDDCGEFHTIRENHNTIISRAYLQDNAGDILFDEDGNALEANTNSYDQANLPSSCTINYTNSECELSSGSGNFGLETSKANYNGWYTIDKRNGVIKFSTEVGEKTIVLEYISDGLEYRDASQVRINKLAEQALYQYIRFMILDNKIGVQEYIVKRARRDFYNSLRIAKARIQGLKYNDLVQAIRGKSKWIK